MPACFQLIGKDTGQPTKFQQIDDEMRVHFGVEPDPVRWYKGWYDYIGFTLATGGDWAKCREIFEGLDEVIDYLEQRYTYNQWQEIGKR